MDKLEAKNVFSSVEARDEFLSRLSAPNHEALANMGVRMSSHSGTIVFNSSTGQSSMAPAQVSDSAPSSEVAQPNKAQWPELKNTPSAEAMRIIMGQRPDVKAMLVPQVMSRVTGCCHGNYICLGDTDCICCFPLHFSYHIM